MKVIEWKPIKDFDGYFINELREVKSTRSFKGTKDYQIVSFWKSANEIQRKLGYSAGIRKQC